MFDLTITDAGLDALVDAKNGDTDAVKVTEIGLTESAFDTAPTLTALPGEFKRLGTVAGQVVAANVIHMTAQDFSEDTYDLRGFGLFLADGTLFATFGQAEPIFSKVSISLFLLAFNVRFSGDIAGSIDFGDASFLNPPATETVRGVAKLATQALTDAGDDDETIVTPLKMKRGLGSRTVTGGGLATGGGDLSEDRVITVSKASAQDIVAGTEGGKVVTPDLLGPLAMLPSVNGWSRLPGGLVLQWGQSSISATTSKSVAFPTSFPTAALMVLAVPISLKDTDDDSHDEDVWASAGSKSAFTLHGNGSFSTIQVGYIAIGY